MGANLRSRAADFVEEARPNGRQKRRLGTRPNSELKPSRRQFSSFLGLCFPARRFGFDLRSEVPFSFRLVQIFTCFEAVFHGRQNSADRATASRAPARSELLRQPIEEFRRHVVCILSRWIVVAALSLLDSPKRFATVGHKRNTVCQHFPAFGGYEQKARQYKLFCIASDSE